MVGYFGDDQLLADHTLLGEGPTTIKSCNYMATVLSNDGATLGGLTVKSCHTVVNTTLSGLGKDMTITSIDELIQYKDLTRHVMLGAGLFGQIWLASSPMMINYLVCAVFSQKSPSMTK